MKMKNERKINSKFKKITNIVFNFLIIRTFFSHTNQLSRIQLLTYLYYYLNEQEDMIQNYFFYVQRLIDL